MDAPSQADDSSPAPDEPGHVPGEDGPRHEERQHPRRVDVGHERAGRMVRVAAAQPQPTSRPVGASVGPGGLATGDQASQQEPAHQAENDREHQPPRIAHAVDLVVQCPTEDTCASPRGQIHSGRRREASSGGGRRSVEGRPGISGHRTPNKYPPTAPTSDWSSGSASSDTARSSGTAFSS